MIQAINENIFFHCRILMKTTQPAHVMTMFAVLLISWNIWPEDTIKTNAFKISSKLTSILYLASFAAHFGAQIWMTFVSGLALYFSLPRHTFGMCQEILFPKYFTLNAALSAITLITFVKIHKDNLNQYKVQQVSLIITLLIELIIRLYCTAPLLKLMSQKYKMESKVGTGQEIGELRQKGLTNCPHYQIIHRQFRKIHMTVAFGNVLTIACSVLHLNFLAGKLGL